jgi:predicted RNA-binding Zn ribbon-like protein
VNFTHYSDEAAKVAADLVNTRGSTSGNEYMPDVDTLRGFLEEHGLDASGDLSEADLGRVQRMRDGLRGAFEAPTEEACAGVLNEMLGKAGARPEVTNHDGTWHLHYVPAGASIADLLAVVSAMGLAGVISRFGFDRLGICSADDCRDVFVDTSRNRSRRYCNDTCSSRMNVAAYRSRHRKQSSRDSSNA